MPIGLNILWLAYVVTLSLCGIILLMLHFFMFQCPTTAAGWREVADGFARRWNFKHCIGAIDGKHVAIRCPPKSGSTFYNYKGFFSIVLLAVVDSSYKFMYIDVGANGR